MRYTSAAMKWVAPLMLLVYGPAFVYVVATGFDGAALSYLVGGAPFFGFGAAFILLWMRNISVTITDVGLIYQGSLRRRFWRWSEIAVIETRRLRRSDLLWFRLKDGKRILLETAPDGVRMVSPCGETRNLLALVQQQHAAATRTSDSSAVSSPGGDR